MPRKKRTAKYMHTLEGRPAYYDGESNKQIVFAGKLVRRLCDSLEQIREERDKTIAFRHRKGWETESFDYGYVRVYVD